MAIQTGRTTVGWANVWMKRRVHVLCVLVMCRGALSCTAVCDCPFCARDHCQVTVPEPQWLGASLPQGRDSQ